MFGMQINSYSVKKNEKFLLEVEKGEIKIICFSIAISVASAYQTNLRVGPHLLRKNLRAHVRKREMLIK